MLIALLPTPANMSTLLWLNMGLSSEWASPWETEPDDSWTSKWTSPWETEPDTKKKTVLSILWNSIIWSPIIRSMHDYLMKLAEENECTVLGTPSIESFAAILDERKSLEPGNPGFIDAILLPKIWRPDDPLEALWKRPGEGTLTFEIALQIHHILETDTKYAPYRGRPTWFPRSIKEWADWAYHITQFTWLDSPDKEKNTSLTLPSGFARGLRHVTLEELIRSIGSK